jgi:hypothetical protein
VPNLEPVVLQQDQVKIRLIGPKASVWPAPPADVQTFSVLGCDTMVARPLPVSNVPASPDFVSGYWTGRLDDAGEAQLVFPNATSSDGTPWRQRFDPTGHLQWIEIYFNGYLDFCGVIDQVTPDQQSVTVHAYDPFWVLKKAYVRDWIVTQAPRDVIERGTKLWVPTAVDNFPAGSISSQWTVSTSGGGTAAIGPNGGLNLAIPASTGQVIVESAAVACDSTSVWSASCTLQNANIGINFMTWMVKESSGHEYMLQMFSGIMTFDASGLSFVTQMPFPAAPSYEFLIESDGEWVSGYVNGQLVGCIRRLDAAATSLQAEINFFSDGGGAANLTVTGVLAETLQPFLMVGSDKGDYVLAGDASTYPSGGLTARYFNDLDLVADSNALYKVLSPPRTQAYGGSSPAEYQDQQDATIANQDNPTPGAATSNWSVKWFGAIYLKLSAGNYSFEIENPATSGCAVRVWVGKTQFGTQLVDEWTFGTQAQIFGFTVSATTLAGTNSDGSTSAKDGWYPIVIEYAVGSTALQAPLLALLSSPAAYTDPGGTAIAAGSQNIVVPSTSLSPLGCIDQRYQGVAHFDLVQQTLQAVNASSSTHPQQLEASTIAFPGVLAPRIREGQDTDVVLQPDLGARQDAEGLLNYSSTLDSSDFATSMQGNGAGTQTGTTGQLQAMVYDAPTMQAALFDAQQWQDFSDASFVQLLQALLNAQLGLSLTPWQLLSADPNGRPRKAYAWPITGATLQMRWRPGFGLRVQAPLINVYDTSPRQLLVITRNVGPFGYVSTQGTFADRPKNPARTLKRQLYTVTRLQRNYQRGALRLTGNSQFSSIAASTLDSGLTIVPLSPGDKIIGATLYIAVNTGNVHVYINGSDETTALNGPWTGEPVVIPIGPVAVPGVGNTLFAQLYNASGSAITVRYQLVADVLR